MRLNGVQKSKWRNKNQDLLGKAFYFLLKSFENLFKNSTSCDAAFAFFVQFEHDCTRPDLHGNKLQIGRMPRRLEIGECEAPLIEIAIDSAVTELFMGAGNQIQAVELSELVIGDA